MRRLALVAAVALLAGCGGKGAVTAPATTAPKPSDPEAAVREYVRTHPQLAVFARGYRVVVSERATDEFGVVAIQRGARVAAFPMRLVGANWRIHHAQGLRVRPIGPQPGAREPVVAQIAAAIDGRGGSGVGLIWVDGITVDPNLHAGVGSVTLVATFATPLTRGRHSVVVLATANRQAAAAAWTFTVR